MEAILGQVFNLNEWIEKMAKLIAKMLYKPVGYINDMMVYHANLVKIFAKRKHSRKPAFNRQADWETTPATEAPIPVFGILIIALVIL